MAIAIHKGQPMNDALVAHMSEQSTARARHIARQMVCYWEEIGETDMPESVLCMLMGDYQNRMLDEVMGIDPTIQAILDAGGEMEVE